MTYIIYNQQAKASRLVLKQGPTNLVKVIFSARKELGHAIIQSLLVRKSAEICSLQQDLCQYKNML